ncbi:SulP family inorganic anion transporter [Microbacterium excoecariae]|uniref:SulP family inorganic anion transporter n=1 Tax=Microbacterium excoecariae TaxID=2715210 RepID=UPI001409B680|nr:SulP family inorganic anion transporter [Microbacterium excoecariae]NHI16291.1 SulP family inorganic anion transporter [Microbacterium excoecariae]
MRKRWAAYLRRDLKADAMAGLVLGVESVPDGLASGLLAGLNPVAGLYAYLYGMLGAAFVTSSAFMAVQATGAMALVVSDANVGSYPDPDRALTTLAILTGIVMIVAGVCRAGSLLRFVPTAVMTGFVSAIGINIVLGQLGNATGYEPDGANRLAKTLDVVLHVGQWQLPTLVVTAITVLVILTLQPTRWSSLGLVVAVVVGSVAAGMLSLWTAGVVTIGDLVALEPALPAPQLPVLGDVISLALPAVSLAFVGLVQGAGVSEGLRTPRGEAPSTSRDFVAQGVGNIVAGLFRGMPVGGSMSASALVVSAGARTRGALVIAAGVMALIIVALADVVSLVAMPALAALLIVVGVGSVSVPRIVSVVRGGPVQTATMVVTFVLTLAIPLQYAVLSGAGLGIVLFVARQSNRIRLRRVEVSPGGRLREADVPEAVPGGSVVILRPYGSLFFASAPVFERQLPRVEAASAGSVVILRLRGVDQVGLSFVTLLTRYAERLRAVGSSLAIVASEPQAIAQLRRGGVVDVIGEERLYAGGEWIGQTTLRAFADAEREVARGRGGPAEGAPL